MIVIATHDNIEFLHMSVDNMSRIVNNKHDVIFIDTNSSSSEFIKEFNSLSREYPKFFFERLNYTCWDTGAYIHSYKKYHSDSYIFLQDSIEIINENYISAYDDLLIENDVVAHTNFGYSYDNEDQKMWAEDGISFENLPEFGIFGPIFGIKRDKMDIIPIEWLKYPTNKNHGCGMERRWSLIFHSKNLRKEYIEKNVSLRDSKYIIKHSPGRN
jgi:hypothetical protein